MAKGGGRGAQGRCRPSCSGRNGHPLRRVRWGRGDGKRGSWRSYAAEQGRRMPIGRSVRGNDCGQRRVAERRWRMPVGRSVRGKEQPPGAERGRQTNRGGMPSLGPKRLWRRHRRRQEEQGHWAGAGGDTKSKAREESQPRSTGASRRVEAFSQGRVIGGQRLRRQQIGSRKVLRFVV